MSDIHEVKIRVQEFFQKELEKEQEAVRFLKLSKSDTGWEALVEVTELNEYLKKLGYPPIFDKNRYAVVLDEGLNVVHYGRGEEEE